MGLFAKIMGEDDAKSAPANDNLKRRKDELKNMGEGKPGEMGSLKTRKAAVAAKRGVTEPEAVEPAAKDDKVPTKYNTPRKPGESMGDYTDRLDAAKKAEKAER